MPEMNPVLEKLPKHLLSLVIDQPYTDYTAQDHAVWRYVMRQNLRYLSDVCYGNYRKGLEATGITIDNIPQMYGMNRILKEIGWAAVAVDGFIPPAAFMEFQAFNVLVIAADIRPVDQILYTPAPDIIHEAAGHAPIIADEEYAAYLKLFGEIGSKAFSSRNDYKLYEAIRHLSILKADPYTPVSAVEKAEEVLESIEKNMGKPSEMARIRNLHWWTVEYGLIGELKKPKIYGAGLLSSIGESYSCLKDDVRKLPYSIAAADMTFDITRPQPQLFVTPDFDSLTTVLLEFAAGMAMKSGGVHGLKQAIESGNIASVELSSGLQISGIVEKYLEDEGKEIFVKTIGESILSYENKVLPNHGKEYHSHGFSSPLGRIMDLPALPEDMREAEMADCGLEKDKECHLVFESGIKLKGVLRKVLRKDNKNLVWTFSDCSVKYKGEFLFLPEWGMFDMALGEKVVSCFSGTADADALSPQFLVPQEKTHKIIHDEKSMTLHQLYEKVRQIREANTGFEHLKQVFDELQSRYPSEWLLRAEINELLKDGYYPELRTKVTHDLRRLAASSTEIAKLIRDAI